MLLIDPVSTPFVILTTLAVLAVLIFVHELGHFLVARWCKVRVLTFAIGFGKTVWSTTRGRTEYALKAIPLGGYVKMYGEDPDDEVGPEDVHETFSSKSVWQRMAIVFAGPLFNILTAILIFCGVYLWGVPVPTATVGEVQAESAAEVAGLLVGDRITAIDGKPITTFEELRAAVVGYDGTPLALTIRRDNAELPLTVAPRRQEVENLFGETVVLWQLGIAPSPDDYLIRNFPPLTAVRMGLERTWMLTDLLLTGVAKLITGSISADNIGGPILIAQATGQHASGGMLQLLSFMAFLSINLGILNLLPIPVLDGGHLVFLTAEAIKGKPVSDRVREVAQQVGIFALLALMTFAFYNDIMRLFTAG